MNMADALSSKLKLPKYDETTLFFINLIVILLLLVDAPMRSAFMEYFSNPEEPILFPVLLAGFLSTFYLALFEVRSNFCKSLMGFYVTMMNLFVGSAALTYAIDNGDGFYMLVFPAINVTASLVILIAFRADLIEPKELISDKQAKKRELLVGIILVPLLIFTNVYVMKNHWTETFSMCLFYVIFVNNAITAIMAGNICNVPAMNTLPRKDESRSRTIAKSILLVFFLIGICTQFGYMQTTQERLLKARQAESAARENKTVTKVKEEHYSVGFNIPAFINKSKDRSSDYNYALNVKDGDVIKVKGTIQEGVATKSESRTPFMATRNSRVVFYNVTGRGDGINTFQDHGYYPLCNSDYAGRLGDLIEFDGIISSYKIYSNLDATAKCILPKTAIAMIDENELVNTALQSYKSRRDFLKRIAGKVFANNKSAYQKFGENIDDFDSSDFYWIADRKEYAVILGYGLQTGEKLNFSFQISEANGETQRLDMFLSSETE